MARGLKKTASPSAATRTPNTARCSHAAADASQPAVFGGDVLASIDWSQPWFAPWRELGESTAQRALQQKNVAEALNARQRTLPLGTAVAHQPAAKRDANAQAQARAKPHMPAVLLTLRGRPSAGKEARIEMRVRPENKVKAQRLASASNKSVNAWFDALIESLPDA